MPNRPYVLGAVATVLLTVASVTALAAGRPPAFTTIAGMNRIGTATCSAPSALPGSRVTIVLGDMGGSHDGGSMMGGSMMGGSMMGGRMMLRADVRTASAGAVSLVAVNRGTRVHELVVLPLAQGSSAGTRPIGFDGKVSETGSLGEASSTCAAGAGEGIRPAASGWVTLSLPAGRYELVCNERGHYRAGMYAELDVT